MSRDTTPPAGERGAARSTLPRVLSSNRLVVQAALDALAWAAAITFGAWVRYDLSWSAIDPVGLGLIVALAIVVQIGAGLAFGLYLGRWSFGSFEEVAAVARTAIVTTVIVTLSDALPDSHFVPLSAPLAGGFAALVLMGSTRYFWRLVRERMKRPSAEAATKLIVFGAGEAATQVVTAMLSDPSSPYVPVALLDDDRAKRNLRIKGIRVQGTREDLERVAREHEAEALLVAVPSGDAELIGDLADRANEAGLAVRVLPSVSELLGTGVDVADIRPITEADLLGRHKISTDIDTIAGYLTGKRVLVTGAGGSIGSELCRQISRFGPSELVMLDRDESALQAVQLSIDGRGQLDSPSLVLCDIRDRDRLGEVFAAWRPEVVFHAAALKHVPLLEQHPGEALRTNVFGTLHVLEAAQAHRVRRFVNISTDKAADPINVLGYTKRITEMLTAHFANANGGVFLSVRFGNVLGSRGSVLETFRRQIERGGPVTVTHPDVTRYFMTLEEAVELVVQAGAIGRDGEVLVLDMGEPVRIAQVAKRLVAQAERPVEVVYTGLRQGEKMREVLLASGEADERPFHPLISHVRAPAVAPSALLAFDGERPSTLTFEMQVLSGAASGTQSGTQEASAEESRPG